MGCGSVFKRGASTIAQPTAQFPPAAKDDRQSMITNLGSGADAITMSSDFVTSRPDDPSSYSENVILCTDSSRVCHYLQYPEGTTHVYSYFECIGGKYEKTLFFGLQYVLKKCMVGPVITVKKINEAKEFFSSHFNQELFNESGWMRIAEQHDGHLPLSVKAVPEGSLVHTHNVLFTVENTDPEVPWITGWFQKASLSAQTLLMQTWYPTTVATNTWYHKELIARYLLDTCGSTASIPYQLHDFGYSGASSVESAAIGGAAHLVSFLTSDNIAGIRLAKQYYGHPMAGYSYPSTEHSTVTPWGPSGEAEACRQAMHAFPSGPASVSSDTHHAANCCEHIWGQELRPLVEARAEHHGGMLIVRLQSGDAPEIVVEVLEILGRHYPVTVNALGFRELPPYVRLMHSEGVTLEVAEAILANAKAHRWSAQNVLLASDGSLVHEPRCPVQRFAFQCSAVVVGGEEREVHRNPMTDTGLRSKRGRLTLQRTDSGYITMERGQGNYEQDCLVQVFRDGHLLMDYTFEEIRRRSEEPLQNLFSA